MAWTSVKTLVTRQKSGNTLRMSPRLPARFLIANRPEPNIRKTFERANLREINHRIVLDDTYEPDRDIRIYL